MSRLLNPGLGDICDRLTILALKILHGEAAGRNVEHFVRERNGLLTKANAAALQGGCLEALLELGAVNAALWQRTDEQRKLLQLRALDGAWPTQDRVLEAANCGCAIMQLNDQRAQLVATINAQVGDMYEEKLS